MSSKVRLSKAKFGDHSFLLKLRNEPGVRKASFNSKKVDVKEHGIWLRKKLKEANTYLWIAKIADKKIGQVRIERENKDTEISIAISSAYRGKGYGLQALNKATRLVFSKDSEVKNIIAYIKPNNLSSTKLFQKAGFTMTKITTYKKNKCVAVRLKR